MANMQNRGRQYRLTALQDIDFQDLVNGSASGIKVSLPTNSIVVGGALIVETAWNSATTATLALALQGGATLLTATNIKATGITNLTTPIATNYTGADVTLTLAETGAAATQGKAKVLIDYIVVDKVAEVQVN